MIKYFYYTLGVTSLTLLNAIAFIPVSAQAAIRCPSLEQAIVPVKHPIRTSLNQKFRDQGLSGKVDNVVRTGNYAAAYWWQRGVNGRYTSASPIAIRLKGNQLDRAVIVNSYIVDVLKSWGASPQTAECLHQILEESGI